MQVLHYLHTPWNMNTELSHNKKKNFHRPEKNDAEMSLLFTQSSYNGEIKTERIDARLPAWLDNPWALIFPGDSVAGGRPNCKMKAKFTRN